MTAPSAVRPTDKDQDEYRRQVIAVVDRAPPLSVTQQAQIALLLREAVAAQAHTSTTPSTETRRAAA